jgi:hypothetical protein
MNVLTQSTPCVGGSLQALSAQTRQDHFPGVDRGKEPKPREAVCNIEPYLQFLSTYRRGSIEKGPLEGTRGGPFLQGSLNRVFCCT